MVAMGRNLRRTDVAARASRRCIVTTSDWFSVSIFASHDMSPSLSLTHRFNRLSGYTVGSTQRCKCFSEPPSFSDVPNRIFCQFGFTRLLTTRTRMRPERFRVCPASIPITNRRTTLRAHVSHVFRVCAQKQMIGTYASRIVATMAHAHPLRDGPVIQCPREPMCIHTLRIQRETTVSVLPSNTSDPLPTPRTFSSAAL